MVGRGGLVTFVKSIRSDIFTLRDIKAIRADVAHIREDLRRFDYRVTNLEHDVANLTS